MKTLTQKMPTMFDFLSLVFLLFMIGLQSSIYHTSPSLLPQTEKQRAAGVLPFDSTMVMLAEALSFPNLLITLHMYSPESARDALLIRSSDFL